MLEDIQIDSSNFLQYYPSFIMLKGEIEIILDENSKEYRNNKLDLEQIKKIKSLVKVFNNINFDKNKTKIDKKINKDLIEDENYTNIQILDKNKNFKILYRESNNYI